MLFCAFCLRGYVKILRIFTRLKKICKDPLRGLRNAENPYYFFRGENSLAPREKSTIPQKRVLVDFANPFFVRDTMHDPWKSFMHKKYFFPQMHC